MKKISVFFIGLFCSVLLFGQTCDIPLQIVFEEESENIPAQAQQLMANQLRSIISSNGIVGSEENTQFALLPSFNVIDKHIIAGPPTKVIYNMNVTLHIINLQDHKVFSTYSRELDAVGNNETKALIDGIKQIKKTENEAILFLQRGKEKIIAYYDDHYRNIIKKAQAMAFMKKYEEALYHISSIPECCKGYNNAMNASFVIFQKYTDQTCLENLGKARRAWIPLQNEKGANEAAQFLSEIYPDAACYGEAMSLYKEIKTKVKDDWNFEMKHYNDAVSIEKQKISAIRDIGVAFGKGQKTQTSNIFLRK
ncbi:MAG: hypothetical protein RR280_06725 [Bacteroidaceae bacterium]